MAMPNTWPTLEAGSVLTSSTRCPASRQLYRRGAGDRGLAYAALAGEEQEARRLFKKFHIDYFQGSAARRRSAASAPEFLPCFDLHWRLRPSAPVRRGSDSGRPMRLRRQPESAAALQPRALQKAFHDRVFSKRHRLLGQVEALDLRAVLRAQSTSAEKSTSSDPHRRHRRRCCNTGPDQILEWLSFSSFQD